VKQVHRVSRAYLVKQVHKECKVKPEQLDLQGQKALKVLKA
jgi:hypothetical protein